LTLRLDTDFLIILFPPFDERACPTCVSGWERVADIEEFMMTGYSGV
jgi:hypothetical protein